MNGNTDAKKQKKRLSFSDIYQQLKKLKDFQKNQLQ